MITSVAFSQPMDIVINGRVTDEKNGPMPKVSVIVKASKAGVTTDDNGTFRINIPSLPVKLTISHTNYTDQEIEVTDTKEVIIRMEPAGSMLEGVVLTSKGIPTRIKGRTFFSRVNRYWANSSFTHYLCL